VLAILWVASIALAAWYIHAHLRVSGDLRLFLPAARTPAQQLLLQEVSEGPATRLLLVTLTGAGTDDLAESSQRLVTALRADPAFRLVENGENRLDSVPEALLPYRYLLSTTLDREHFTAAFLRSQLEERERDLASPAAGLLEPWLPRDPTLEILKLLESWQPPHEAQVIDDVWFDGAGTAALLVVETTAPAFDPESQRVAIGRLREHFAVTRASPSVRLTALGPGAFSVLMQSRSEADGRLAGFLDTAGMVLLMLIAYRRPRFVVLGALPLATAGVAGLAAVAALYGQVHGITIAFGFTLIGVALDYPIFLFSHQLPGVSATATVRSIWPTLATAIAGLCIAYLAFLVSGVVGLAQLACFNITALAAAGLATRYLLPRLLPPGSRDYGASALAVRLAGLGNAARRPPWLAPVLAAAAIAVILLVPGPLWENDLGRLTPVPRSLLLEYANLQRALGAPDVRYLLAVDGASADEVVAREERLAGALQGLVSRGAISAFDDAARYLPSAESQLHRQAALPQPGELRASLEQAALGLAFRPGLFQPFLEDVARARRLPPLTPAGLAGTPLELSIGSLLLARPRRWTGIVTFSEVHDPAALAAFAAAAGTGVSLLDLKQAAEDLVADQRGRILASIALATVLLAVVVYAALRSAIRLRRVMTPMVLTGLLTVALLHAAGIALNLFHVIALVLAAGLGLDYGLFFERSAHDPSGRRRTLHALLVCAVAACTVFAVLAISALPVLRSIGITVVIGVTGNFVLALLTIEPQSGLECSDAKPLPR
jgi:predicted exporter